MPTRQPPRHRPPLTRRLRLAAARLSRARTHIERRAALATGWVWIAAISFVGVEMFEIVFGTFLLAPEFLPLAVLALAAAWFLRERIRAVRDRAASWLRRLGQRDR